MKFLGKDIVRHLGRILQYVPVAIAFFLRCLFGEWGSPRVLLSQG